MTKFGKPAMITAVDMKPDGKYARVTRMTKPFSYIVPVSSFGSIEEVWDATGTALAKLSERPLNLGAQADTPDPVVDPTNPHAGAARQPAAGGGGGRGGAANDNGKRELTWRADGQGFNYLQLEPPPPARERGGGGRGGGRNGGGGGRRWRGGAAAAADGRGAARRRGAQRAAGSAAQGSADAVDAAVQRREHQADLREPDAHDGRALLAGRPDRVLHRGQRDRRPCT